MRCLFLLTSIMIAGGSSGLVCASDELFSKVQMNAVQTTPESSDSNSSKAPSSSSGKSVDVTGLKGLDELLQDSDLEFERKESEIQIRAKSEDWILPGALRVVIDQDCIQCDLSLVKLEDVNQIDRNVLLQLLAAGSASQRACFVFDPDQKVILLRASVSNRQVTRAGLLADIQRLARLADSHAATWSKLTGTRLAQRKSGQSGSATSPNSNANQPAASPEFRLDGQWSAKVGQGEAFAVRFDPDQRFVLVHLKNGASTKSTGKIQRREDRLLLAGDDGIELNSRLTWRRADLFQLEILRANGDPALRLDFFQRR